MLLRLNRFCFRYENDELKPYVEPEPDMSDHKRIEALVCLGYHRIDIENSLDTARYDDVFATYLLLGRKSTDVSMNLYYFIAQIKQTIMMYMPLLCINNVYQRFSNCGMHKLEEWLRYLYKF